MTQKTFCGQVRELPSFRTKAFARLVASGHYNLAGVPWGCRLASLTEEGPSANGGSAAPPSLAPSISPHCRQAACGGQAEDAADFAQLQTPADAGGGSEQDAESHTVPLFPIIALSTITSAALRLGVHRRRDRQQKPLPENERIDKRCRKYACYKHTILLETGTLYL